ncbi:MAG: hypothetical protein RMA76_29440 [Deltaproteobacteria bacterium]|jgi:hypothetical protein
MQRIDEPTHEVASPPIDPTAQSDRGDSPVKFAVVVFLLPLLLAVAAMFWSR